MEQNERQRRKGTYAFEYMQKRSGPPPKPQTQNREEKTSQKKMDRGRNGQLNEEEEADTDDEDMMLDLDYRSAVKQTNVAQRNKALVMDEIKLNLADRGSKISLANRSSSASRNNNTKRISSSGAPEISAGNDISKAKILDYNVQCYNLLGTVNIETLRSANPTPIMARKNIRKVYNKKSSSSNGSDDTAQVGISTIFKQQPGIVDGSKLKAVGRNITTVALGTIPVQCTHVTTAYLSNNKLSSLEGLKVLKELRCLSVAHNLISRMQILHQLGESCPALEVLILEGNPICAAPYYRLNTIFSLPCLKQLDGRDISTSERQNAPIIMNTEDAAISLLITGACHVQMLENIFKLSLVHQELRVSKLISPYIVEETSHLPLRASINVKMLSELWDYEGSLSKEELGDLTEALRMEMQRETNRERYSSYRRKEVSIDDAFDAAFKTIQTRQQRSSAALETAILSPSHSISFAALLSEDFFKSVQNIHVHPNNTNEKINYRKSKRSKKGAHSLKIFDNKDDNNVDNKVDENDAYKQGITLENTHTFSQQYQRQGNLLNNPLRSSQSQILKPEIQNEIPGCMTEDDLKISVETDFGKDTQSKETDEKEIKEFTHVLETQQKQIKLRKQLLQIEDQSRCSIKQAENELMSLQKDMERALELQIILEKRAMEAESDRDMLLSRAKYADQLESQVAELLQRLAETEDTLAMELSSNQELEEENANLMKQKDALQIRVNESEKLVTLEYEMMKLSSRSLKRRIFKQFCDSVEMSILEKQNEYYAIKQERQMASRLAWQLFGKAVSRERTIRLFRESREVKLSLVIFNVWRAQRESTRLEENTIVYAQRHYSKRLMRDVLRSLTDLVWRSSEIAIASSILGARLWLRRWWRYHIHVTRPRRQREAVAIQLRNQMLMWRAFQSWIFMVSAGSVNRAMIQASLRLRGAVLIGSAFSAFVEYTKHRRISKVQALTANTVFVGMRLRRWRQRYYRTKSYRLRLERFNNDKLLKLYRQSFIGWNRTVHVIQSRRQFYKVASDHYTDKTYRKYINKWNKVTLASKTILEEHRKMEQVKLSESFHSWKALVDRKRLWERNNRKADRHFSILLAKSLRFVLIYWADVSKSKRHFRKLVNVLHQRLCLNLIGRTFRSWHGLHYSCLKSKLEVAEERITELITIQVGNESKLKDVTSIQNELSNKLQTAHGEIIASKAVVAQNETQMLRLDQKMNEYRISQKDAQDELCSLKVEMENYKDEIEKLNITLKESKDDATEQMTHSNLRQQQLLSEIEALRLVLSEKQMLLATCESVLEDAAVQLEATAATCDDDTMKNIFEVAGGLRQLIRESQSEGGHTPTLNAQSNAKGDFDSPQQKLFGLSTKGVVQRFYDIPEEISNLHERITSRLDSIDYPLQPAM